MSYIGNPIVSTDFPVDYASGNGSTTTFTLSVAPASVNSIDVQISGVSQSPQTYSVSGTTLTFSAAPPTGTNNIVVRHKGVAGIPNTPSAASVVTTSIANNAVTPAKMANGGAEFGMRNRIINGAMVIDQRNAGAATAGSYSGYTLDRWSINQSTSGKLVVQQNNGSVTPPSGFKYYLGATSQSAYSVGAGDYYFLNQSIEGYNLNDLDSGTANAKATTLSFWVYSGVAGTLGGSIYKGGSVNRSYVFTYSVPTINTWTFVTVAIAGDTAAGLESSTNGTGFALRLGLGTGTTLSGGTVGSWVSGNYVQPSSTVSIVGTNGAAFFITGVQLEVGSTATGFDYRPYGTELALCQRYYWRNNDPTATSTFIPCGNGYTFNSTTGTFQLSFPVTMRTRVATINFSNVRVFGAANGSAGVVTSISGIQSTNTVFQADVAASSASFTAGTPAALQGNNNTAAYAEFSAEL